MNIKDQVQKMDAIVAQGAIVDAVKDFFADNAVTADYRNSGTNGKPEMVKKMEGFANAIAKVNGITHHHTIVDKNISASEFTFDFDMKDGSKIYWHEIIRRIWNDQGKVTQETYFNAE
ncbi:hypothetical protein J8L88_17100 [Aquimarina sp. MMG015]|uniref:hypothetical protein n=1 Tax=Aquimarina sp. MMG015 TaxID=2822689 RepID=UPI001B39EB0E|nr:hypothetical protein [Aquimarina sp. MMG015]MBQ4804581.1 hypothetical protein [Aquimarina sp. MMG015]